MEKMSFEFEENEYETNSWKILIADDELEVHTITALVLNNVKFLGKPLEFISAYSGAEACEVMKKNPDIALVLLDVVMETNTSGIEVVRFIREELKNLSVRIVFRTGMPGHAPEREVIDLYDINDYKEKTELTAQKLYTTVIAGLRNYRDLLIAEQSKQKTEKIMLYFRRVIDSMLSGVIVINSNYKIELYTHQVLDSISADVEKDITGTNIFESLPFFVSYKKEIDTILEKQCCLERMMISTGKNKIINLIFCPLNEIDNRVAIRVDDVTLLIEKERQLMHLQKLETIGMLAAGITHDFNNILGGISGTVSLLQLEAHESNDSVFMNAQDYNEYLDMISKSVTKATDLSRKLISLSKNNIAEMKCINLIDVITATVNICKASIAHCVRIQTVMNTQVADINGDSNSLEQMLLNLCINASHAMTIMRSEDKLEWGGTLTITLDYNKVAPKEFNMMTEDCYVLSVADTGVGMSEETKEKIFNPFFSTKKKGEGIGLGLLMVNNIISTHKGFLKIISEQGVGTEFKIYFPVFMDGDK